MEIRPFQPKSATEREWAVYHRFRLLRHEEREPDDPLIEDRAMEKLMKRRDPEWEVHYFAVIDSQRSPDDLSGWLELGLAREGSLAHETNAHMMWVGIEVLASERKRGIGTRLLAKAAEFAEDRRRTLLIGGTDEDDGKTFIDAIGAKVAQRWRESRLYLDSVDWEMLEEWVRDGENRSPDSSLRFFTNYPDDSMLEEYCELLQEVSNQEPREHLDLGDEFLTPAILKERVASYVGAGGTILRAVTQEKGGDLSGLTTMGYLPAEDSHITQWMTGVKDVYRGRGLGKWLKAAMLLKVRDELPQVKVVKTGNVTSNAAMLSINVRLGFRPYREGVEAQISLKAAEAYLKA